MELRAQVERGVLDVPDQRPWFNLHCHSFYSFNAYGMSPSALVWKARTLGLALVGLVDFDVLDGVKEFHAAGRRVGVRTVAAMETRAFLPPFADRELNSPGEPGITYHMGSGFIRSAIAPENRDFAEDLLARVRHRNIQLLDKVNAFLDPVQLDYEEDVLPLTPRGVATERHICQAYRERAEAVLPDPGQRTAYWAERLGEAPPSSFADEALLQAQIRSVTMKKGGVGYQQPDRDTFPGVEEMNRFVSAEGAIPMMTWLDGTSEGEAAIGELMDAEARAGAVAINIVPDRNWNISDEAAKARKVANLYRVVEEADARGWPIQVGTELNAPGLKMVDDLDAPELAPVRASFERGAFILFGHTVERLRSGHGYCSAWARDRFPTTDEKNDYFETLGRATTTLPEVENGDQR